MLWKIAISCYILLNVLGITFFRKMLGQRIQNPAMVWLFSISLSLSINFLLILLVTSLYIRSLNIH